VQRVADWELRGMRCNISRLHTPELLVGYPPHSASHGNIELTIGSLPGLTCVHVT